MTIPTPQEDHEWIGNIRPRTPVAPAPAPAPQPAKSDANRIAEQIRKVRSL